MGKTSGEIDRLPDRASTRNGGLVSGAAPVLDSASGMRSSSVTPAVQAGFRRLVFWVHLGAGSLAGIVILFLAITGCTLTYQRQIIAWAEWGYRSTPQTADAQGIPIHTLLSLAAEAKGEAPDSIVLHADSRAPVEVTFGKDERLLLDRYTGTILGAGATRTRAFFTTVTSLHRWFGASPDRKPVARAVKGAFDLALLLMIVTGIFLWWPGKWSWRRFKARTFLRLHLKGHARDWNRHNVLGFWASLPLAIIVITGAILAYAWATNLLYLVADGTLPKPVVAVERARKDEQRDVPNAKEKVGALREDSLVEFKEIDQLFVSAQQQAVGWHSLSTTLPQAADRQITFTVDFYDGSRPDEKAQLVFDRVTGGVIQWQPYSSYSLGKRLRLFVRNVHTGEAGGIPGQTLSGLAGLSCCALVWTGFRLLVRRLRSS